jgi:hypothetical protein
MISPCGKYRYRLRRGWRSAPSPLSKPGGSVLWIMLNPSTADATVNDNTIRRCISFTRSWGYSELMVGNLYALRSTNPAGLWVVDDPYGPENREHVYDMASTAALIVAAWGRHAHKGDADPMADLLSVHGDVWCLGLNANGSPKHPLMLPAETERILFAPKMRRSA